MKRRDVILTAIAGVSSVVLSVMMFLIARNTRLFEERVDQRFEAVDQRINEFEKRVEQRFEAVDQRFEAVDQRFDRLEKRVDKMENTLENLTQEVYKISGYLFAASAQDKK